MQGDELGQKMQAKLRHNSPTGTQQQRTDGRRIAQMKIARMPQGKYNVSTNA